MHGGSISRRTLLVGGLASTVCLRSELTLPQKSTSSRIDLYYSPYRNVSRKNIKDFDQIPLGHVARGPRGALFVGSPAEVTDKILVAHEIVRFDRFLIQMAIGVMDHAKLMKAIKVLGTRVAPEVRKEIGVESKTA